MSEIQYPERVAVQLLREMADKVSQGLPWKTTTRTRLSEFHRLSSSENHGFGDF